MKSRVVSHTRYLETPLMDFPWQTARYLEFFSSEQLAGLCESLALSVDGNKRHRHRRIIREVGYRENWLPRLRSITEATFTIETISHFVRWYQVLKNGRLEKDFYQDFEDEMAEVFGDNYVHPQLPIGAGVSLKIDFHLGHPQRQGVGVEFKMPRNNAEIQKAVGQAEQYKTHYADRLIVVLLPDHLDVAKQTLFVEQLQQKGIRVMIKRWSLM